MQGLEDLYREVILDHYRQPHGSEPLADPSVEVEGFNPLCGDELVMKLQIDGDVIRQIEIQPKGCSISVASSSMLAQLLPGRTLAEARELEETFKTVMRGGDWPAGTDPGDLEALEGVKNFPVRIKCALLAWMTLERALAEHDPDGVEVEADADIEVRAKR